jgi:hypothetical protein
LANLLALPFWGMVFWLIIIVRVVAIFVSFTMELPPEVDENTFQRGIYSIIKTTTSQQLNHQIRSNPCYASHF